MHAAECLAELPPPCHSLFETHAWRVEVSSELESSEPAGARGRGEMKTVFFDVDTQIDFLYPSGALYVPGAEAIVDRVAALNRWAAITGYLRDLHHGRAHAER